MGCTGPTQINPPPPISQILKLTTRINASVYHFPPTIHQNCYRPAILRWRTFEGAHLGDILSKRETPPEDHSFHPRTRVPSRGRASVCQSIGHPTPIRLTKWPGENFYPSLLRFLAGRNDSRRAGCDEDTSPQIQLHWNEVKPLSNRVCHRPFLTGYDPSLRFTF